MDINYKIIDFNKTLGSIVVEFEDFPPINIDLPVRDNKYPEGIDLDTYIKGFLPIEFVIRKEALKKGISNEAYIESLIQAPRETIDYDKLADEIL